MPAYFLFNAEYFGSNKFNTFECVIFHWRVIFSFDGRYGISRE